MRKFYDCHNISANSFSGVFTSSVPVVKFGDEADADEDSGDTGLFTDFDVLSDFDCGFLSQKEPHIFPTFF